MADEPKLVLPAERRFHAFCIGTAKSGTHSIASMFNKFYKSAHEPDSHFMVGVILRKAMGLFSQRELSLFVKKRDERLQLEMEASNLNYYVLDDLLREFPEAKHVLTIRDCYSWLASAINHHLNGLKDAEHWHLYRDLRYKAPDVKYAPQEKVLKEMGVHPLEGYLIYWAAHNSRVLELVPKEKLLIIRTDEISNSAEKMAAFFGIPVGTLDTKQSHEFQAPRKFAVLSKIDPDFLEEKFTQSCRKLMDAYFPEFPSYKEWRAKKKEGKEKKQLEAAAN